MNMLKENMRLIAECSQKLVRLGENLWGKEQKLDKQMQEHQKLCDEIMDIQEIEPIEAEMEQIIHCPEGYMFKDENGNVINATKIVLEKKKKEYPKTFRECQECLGEGVPPMEEPDSKTHRRRQVHLLEVLLICRDAYWKIAGEEMGLGKPWEPDWKNSEMKYTISFEEDEYTPYRTFSVNCPVAFPTEEMRDAFYENFKEEIENCKELL